MILLLIWLGCALGQADYVIPLPDLATCQRAEKAVTSAIENFAGGRITTLCSPAGWLYETPDLGDDCRCGACEGGVSGVRMTPRRA